MKKVIKVFFTNLTVVQLRKNLELYDRMKEKSDKKLRKEQIKPNKGKIAEKSEKKTNQKERKEIRCFSCGSMEHITRVCPQKDEGPKCFKCNRFGHIATKYEASNEITKKDQRVNVISVINDVPTDDEMIIIVNGVPVMSMTDTGTRTLVQEYSCHIVRTVS